MKIQIFALIDKEATSVNNDSVWCLCTDEASMTEAKAAFAEPLYAPHKQVKWVTCQIPLSDLEDGFDYKRTTTIVTGEYPILAVL